MKAFWAWVYNWVTVIGALIVGGASLVLEQIDVLYGIDWSFVPPDKAIQIVSGIALLKFICAAIKTFSDWRSHA